MGRLAILMVLGLILTTSYYFISMNKSQTTALDTTLFLNSAVEARNVANSYVLSAIGEYMNTPNTTSEERIEELNEKYAQIVPQGLAENATVSVQLFDSSSDASLDTGDIKFISTAVISAVGVKNQTLTCTTEVLSSTFDYGDYALFINDFDSEYLWTTEKVTGDVHVNGGFGIRGAIGETGPIFDGDVTSTEDPYYNGGVSAGNYTGFLGDTDFSYGEIEMPTFNISPSNYPNMLNLDDYKMRYVRFLPNGDVLLSKAHDGHGKTVTISAADMQNVYGGMIYGTGKGGANSNNAVHVEGVVNGNYTVVSPDKIYITGNITVTPDPRVDPTSTSMLAIMSHDDLLTDWRYGVNSGTRDSLLIMASIFTDGTVRAGNHAKPGDYGNFTVFGTRIQGTFSEMIDNSNQLWHQQIIYDDRLRNMTPPGFEFTGAVKIVSWLDSI